MATEFATRMLMSVSVRRVQSEYSATTRPAAFSVAHVLMAIKVEQLLYLLVYSQFFEQKFINAL
jgi:hypothetical protein